uniref:Uncharacterized protein n=1 Tax=Panagrolaimus sp. JU765 TaxID=591449 RepID=A0AC34PVB3_9BILA
MVIIKAVVCLLLFYSTIGYEIDFVDYPILNYNSQFQNVAQKRSDTIDTIENVPRILRDPGWRHIGLGKRALPRQLSSEKTWSMMGLGR